MQLVPIAQIKDFFTMGHERSVKIKKNIIASLIIKGLSILTNFLLIPLTLHYLTPTKYGIWITLYSIIGWFTFFDIGLGNGLRNKFAEALAKGEKDKAQILISTTYGLLSIISFSILILFLIVNYFIDWTIILNTQSDLKTELSSLAIIVFSFFCLRLVLKLIGVIVVADQKPALNSLFNLLSNIISLIIIFILTKVSEGSLLLLGTTVSVTPVLVFISASHYLYNKDYREYLPKLRLVDLRFAKGLLNLGGKFFIIQVSAIVLNATDNIIITQLFGPDQVTPYYISFKYFSIVTMFFSIIIAPFWSAFTDAYTKNDISWIENIVKKINRIWLLVVIVVILMIFLSGFVYKIWIGSIVSIPFNLTILMAIYVLITSYLQIYVQFINGLGKLQIQTFHAIFIMVCNIPLSILLATNLNMGISGVIIATILCQMFALFWVPLQYNKLINNSAIGIWNK